MKSRRRPSGTFVPISYEEEAASKIPALRVDPWPETLGASLEHDGKQITFEIHSRSLGIGFRPHLPHTECRQVELRINHGDLQGFRYIALGIPLRARTPDPYLWVIPYDGGTIVLAICEARVRFRDWLAFDHVVYRNDGVHYGARSTDTGRRLTKTQARKLDQAQQLLDAVGRGRFTLRGRPHEERDAARARLVEAGLRLRAHGWKIGRRELLHTLPLGSVDGVDALLRRAGWKIKDLDSTSAILAAEAR